MASNCPEADQNCISAEYEKQLKPIGNLRILKSKIFSRLVTAMSHKYRYKSIYVELPNLPLVDSKTSKDLLEAITDAKDLVVVMCYLNEQGYTEHGSDFLGKIWKT